MKTRIYCCFGIAILAGCVTPRPAAKTAAPAKRDIIEKAQDKPAETASSPKTAETAAVKPPTAQELWKFLKSQSKADAAWGDAERDLAARMKNEPDAGTVAEAALVIAVVRSTLHPLHQEATTFEESDLAPVEEAQTETPGSSAFEAPTPYAGSGPSLEKLSEARGINIPDALTENPLLGSASIARATLEALRVGPNSAEFMNDVITSVRARADRWREVSVYLGDQVTEAAEEGESETPAFDPNLPPNPADLRSGDTLLADAQKLADQGNYKAALERIQYIPESSPLYSVAQEKTRDFSNRAVQDLRRKAAQAFRSALPSADLETRAQYLREAKAFLEQAIQNYPQAPQLPTVRENLRVISQDLERLENERG